MTDQKALGDTNEGTTPDDVATLYSWANLHGAKYRDFSSSRAQAREEARVRVEEALAAERQRKAEEDERKAQEEAQLAARLAAEAAEAARQAEAERLAEIARQAEAERQAVLAAQEAQRQAAQHRAWQPPAVETHNGGYAQQFSAQTTNQQESEPFAAATDDLPSFASHQYATPDFVTPAPMAHASAQSAPSAPFVQPVHIHPPTQVSSGAPAYASQQIEPWRDPQLVSQALPPRPAQPQQPPQHQVPAYAGQAGFQNPASRPAHPTYSPNPIGHAQNPFPEHVSTAPANAPYAAYPTYVAPAYAAQSYPPAAADAYMASPWPSPEQRDTRELRDPNLRPAWLAPELPAAPVAPAAPAPSSMQSQYSAGTMPSTKQTPPQQQSGPGHAPGPGSVDETLVGSRDRIASRWYALKSVFDPNAAPVEQQPAQAPARVPVLAVFSLAGGVGKTSIVAALGRALSSRGERVLLVDTASYGLLPFFFGARDQRPGQLRTFNPPTVSAEAPIQLVTLDPDGPAPADVRGEGQSADPNQPRPQDHDWLLSEIVKTSRGSSRILIDLPTASGATTRRILRMGPVVLVPVVPDMSSVVSVGAIESFFRNTANVMGKPILPYYVLNQFDYSLPLHLDVREILREQIGDRLLPFALRRSPSISEALAEGMTVMDYAPTATVAEDYASLAGWVRGLSAPATVAQRGVRWSER